MSNPVAKLSAFYDIYIDATKMTVTIEPGNATDHISIKALDAEQTAHFGYPCYHFALTISTEQVAGLFPRSDAAEAHRAVPR